MRDLGIMLLEKLFLGVTQVFQTYGFAQVLLLVILVSVLRSLCVRFVNASVRVYKPLIKKVAKPPGRRPEKDYYVLRNKAWWQAWQALLAWRAPEPEEPDPTPPTRPALVRRRRQG